MQIEETPFRGLFVVDPEKIHDERGFFARTFCVDEFGAAGLEVDYVQSNISYNVARATLRGLHYQASPFGEVKLVRCTAGVVHDVVVDLRRGSPTHLQHFSVELSAANRRALYIPKGFAHGFVTLADDTEVLYMMSSRYAPEHARGLRWNDPVLGLHWPVEPAVILNRDATYADYTPAADYIA